MSTESIGYCSTCYDDASLCTTCSDEEEIGRHNFNGIATLDQSPDCLADDDDERSHSSCDDTVRVMSFPQGIIYCVAAIRKLISANSSGAPTFAVGLS